MWDKLSDEAKSGPGSGQVRYVQDGGALLYRVPWQRQATYEELCQNYCKYVLKKYGREPTVVFDGYDELNNKNMTQLRRSAGKVGATVTFSEGMKVLMKRELFLANLENKKLFITTLRGFLEKDGIHTIQADGDADVLIVETAVESAAIETTVLVGDDTDLLVLLCYHTKQNGFDLYFRPEPKANAKQAKVWNMKKVQWEIGHVTCQNMLFLHAIAGCDTTSRPFGIGKSAPLKKFSESYHFQENSKVFNSEDSTIDEVAKAGEDALVSLYGGKDGDTLDNLRYRRYCERVCSKGRKIEPQNLPPTSAAGKFHSFRVFLQVKQWQGYDEDMCLEDWGWKIVEDQVIPETTDLNAAPDNLLKMIRCNCASDCSSARCTCRKHGLDCSVACGQCKGTSCTNVTRYDNEDGEED